MTLLHQDIARRIEKYKRDTGHQPSESMQAIYDFTHRRSGKGGRSPKNVPMIKAAPPGAASACQRPHAFSERKHGFSRSLGSNKRISEGKRSSSNSIGPAFSDSWQQT